MKRIIVLEKKTGELIIRYEVFNKKLYENLLKKLKKDKRLNVLEEK